MRPLFIFLLFLTLSCVFRRQNVSKSEARKYKNVYQYISHLDTLQGKHISVSDTIVHIERSAFFEVLSKEPYYKGKEIHLLDSINQVDKSTAFRKYFSPFTKTLNKNKERTNWIMYFSKPYGNTLVVEVLNNRGYRKASYERVTMFNKSLLLFIRFNSADEIEKVYTTEVIYN